MKKFLFLLLLITPTMAPASVPLWKKEMACKRLDSGGSFAEKWFKQTFSPKQRQEILTHCYVRLTKEVQRNAASK